MNKGKIVYTWLYQKRKTDNIFLVNRLWNAAKMWTVGTRNLELFFHLWFAQKLHEYKYLLLARFNDGSFFFCALNCSEMWMIQTILWNKQTSDFLITSVSIKIFEDIEQIAHLKSKYYINKIVACGSAYLSRTRKSSSGISKSTLDIHKTIWDRSIRVLYVLY